MTEEAAEAKAWDDKLLVELPRRQRQMEKDGETSLDFGWLERRWRTQLLIH